MSDLDGKASCQGRMRESKSQSRQRRIIEDIFCRNVLLEKYSVTVSVRSSQQAGEMALKHQLRGRRGSLNIVIAMQHGVSLGSGCVRVRLPQGINMHFEKWRLTV